MPTVQKTVLVPYSVEQMFGLVTQVEHYPQFLPWCGGASVAERTETTMQATVHIDFKGVKQSFTTRNTHQLYQTLIQPQSNTIQPSRIDMALLDGPFQDMTGSWVFYPLRADACKVEFQLTYQFSNRLIETVVGPVFNLITSTFVDSFCQRAEQLYGA
jgi:ribosome-associated toxin RatA of RatAB toxin-antitoxin module